MQSAPLAPLSAEQQRFAAENHNLIYAFLHRSGCDADEYYGAAAIGFLRAVQRYLTQPRLRRYAFATVAWQAMGREIARDYRSELRQRSAERRCGPHLNTEPPDLRRAAESRLILGEAFAAASPQQRTLARLRLEGYSLKEAALIQGIEVRQAGRLLKELRRIYTDTLDEGSL